MTAPPTSIDHAVAVLFRAIAGHARGDALAVVDARSELVALAGAAQDFEAHLVTAVVDRLEDNHLNASRAEIEQAIRIDVRRHVTSSVFLAQLEPWGHA
jgi:hypothetical protein